MMSETPNPIAGEQPEVQPQMPVAPEQNVYQQQPVYGQPVNPEAGKGLSIAGIILGIFIPIVGLIMGIIGMNQNKKAGGTGKLGLAAIIVSVVSFVLGLIVVFAFSALIATMMGDAYYY